MAGTRTDLELGDVQAALEAASPLVVAETVGDFAQSLVRQDKTTREVVDTETWQAEPARRRGTVTALTAEGFVTAVTTIHEVETFAANVYSDADQCRLVCVLNDDAGGIAGWRDHKVLLDLRATPEWALWTGAQGLGSQQRFAETIEQGEAEIVRPTATVMLDLAQTFHASVAARFKVANRLTDGRTQLVYEEDVDAKAGTTGETTIPGEFVLGLRPFHGAERYEVRARLRYRLRSGALEIGYFLHRADDVRRLAFADVAAKVGEALSALPMIEGQPAPPPSRRG